MRTEDQSRALIERYIAAYNAFDVPGMLVLLHPDVTFENVVGGEVTATLFRSRCQTIQQYVPTVTEHK
jgi:ketosteroid isomerase-like protein